MYRVYTKSESVLEKMYKITPMFTANLFFYMMKEICVTLLVGIGIQKKTMTFNVVSYAVIALPISFYATFHLNLYYYGPWLGLTICTGSNALYYYILYLRNVKEHSYFWGAKNRDLPEYDHER